MNSNDEIAVHIGRRLVVARRLLGVSKEALAVRLGVSAEQFDQYEKGCECPTAARLWDVARELRINVSLFYDGDVG